MIVGLLVVSVIGLSLTSSAWANDLPLARVIQDDHANGMSEIQLAGR